MLIKGIISFPTLFTPRIPKGATEAKFSVGVLLPPTDPQVQAIQAEVAAAKANGFPNGYTGADECFEPYDQKYAGKDYYDPRFTGWWIFTCTAKAEDRPEVVDVSYNKVIDPGMVFSGMVAYVHAGISSYTKGKGGIGGWLNGVMITAEEPPMGRLDNKPSVEQMFGNINGAQTAPPQQPAAPAAPTAPTPPAPPAAPPAPPAATGLVMTPAANGVTYDAYKASGWTDEQMIAAGLAIKPSFA